MKQTLLLKIFQQLNIYDRHTNIYNKRQCLVENHFQLDLS